MPSTTFDHKYGIGERVWIWFGGKALPMRVTGVTCSEEEDGPGARKRAVEYWLEGATTTFQPEREVFRTEEAAMSSGVGRDS